MEENKGENQISERWVIMDLKTKDSFDFKSERRSGKLFKRIISGITAAAMAAGLLTTSAFADEEVTYEHPSDINSVVDIMKLCFHRLQRS